MTESETFVLTPGPLALEAGALAHLRRAGGRLTRADASVFAAAGSRPPASTGPFALVQLVGLIAPGVPSWLGTDPNVARAQVRAARTSSASALAVLVNSPGGLVEGVPELAEELFAARKSKPTVAIVSGLACSAAYWIASQAGWMTATLSARVGSIGVYAEHMDASGAYAQMGLKPTLISSTLSPHKVEGNDTEPLSDDARAFIAREVNRLGYDFVLAVAHGRGTNTGRVALEFGGGRALDARTALHLHMVDEISTPEDALARLAKTAKTGGPAALALHRLRVQALFGGLGRA